MEHGYFVGKTMLDLVSILGAAVPVIRCYKWILLTIVII
jgi:hypothetical protein